MEITLRSLISLLLLLFSFLNCNTSAQEPDDTETPWKGKRRLIVLEEVRPMKKNLDLRWVRGWDCGWTPHGLCFSPYWRTDIHDNFIIPFKDLKFSVYVDEPADAGEFGINAAVLASFSKKKNTLWEGRVFMYHEGYNWAKRRRLIYKIFVRTEYQDLGNNQLKEAFHPNEVKLKGAHNACRYFKTECKSFESCQPRRLSGHIWPGVYRCTCSKKGWHVVRGRGCMDLDECEQSPCGALFVCENTIGSYKCHCRPGYKGSKCDVEIDACRKNPCPKNRVCKNTPESFECSCLPGLTGKNCSEIETTEEKTTVPSVQEHGNKRIAIPRKKPIKIIRKPVFSHDPRRTEIAAMSILTVLLNGLAVFLYWSQWKKRAKNHKNDKGTSQSSNQDCKNEGTRSTNQVTESTKLNLGETIFNYQQLENNEVILRNNELKMNSETCQRSEEMDDNETIKSDKELGSREVNLSNKELVNTEDFSLNQELKLRGTFASNEDSENPERFPNNQELKFSETFPSNQNLDGADTILFK